MEVTVLNQMTSKENGPGRVEGHEGQMASVSIDAVTNQGTGKKPVRYQWARLLLSRKVLVTPSPCTSFRSEARLSV